ncbi:MAG: dicarboxylate/amino acid:cation symporter [Corynebacterium sp.]|uniref:dicarboxylate/amino acid:cation symporter n=1 Tax=Corynebacterium sp. TaxID=1720 RepID=UPI0026DCE827|nr:dicarboxylate/amino acid:cation symporter [Corynebacterium sp.]MDO5029707.1 dicarboxylate/amino acid:cation symporter [Corynebacterium sp.]
MSTPTRFTQTLLFRVIVAIILGIICSFFFPEWLARIFVTFNGLFGNFLGFFIPVLIFALITPAIASLGRGAGKWLGITTAIAYGSTVFSGLIAYAATQGLYLWLLGSDQAGKSVDIEKGALEGFFNVEMPPPFDVMTALLLAFTVGVAMTSVKSDSLYRGAAQLRDVIMKIIESFIIPLLPVYIFGMFLAMGMNGNLTTTLSMFFKVLILAIIGTVVLLAIQFSIAGAVAGRNPWTSLKNMMPAYATALGTSSSAATIPVTYKAAVKNGVSEKVAGFTVPLCATIHLAGSMMKITLFAFAVMFMADKPVSPGMAIGFILTLGITMIAAPGVPGGAIMAAVGVLQSMLGFDQEQVALMIAAYIAIDSFGTACNVTGDGAIAMIVNRFAKDDVIDRSEDLTFDPTTAESTSSKTEG